MENSFAKIFEVLKKSGFKVFGPKEQDGETHILELKNPSQKSPPAPLFKRGGAKGGSIFLPPLQRGSEGDFVFLHSWKYFFTPTRETLYKYEGGKPKVLPQGSEKRALFGMSIFDCKAMELYDRIFSDDIYYQQNRKNIFIIGYSAVPVSKIKTIFFEPNLESAVFDIFIDAGTFYARGKQAEKVLRSCGIKYKVVSYKKNEPDPTSPHGLRGASKKVLAIKKAMEAGKGSKMWDELGKICLACGKCTVACPTCYCFDIESKIGPECQAERCNGNCFYDDFTRIAGGHKFLNNPAEKIFFWYYHKFVRIPFQYGLPGCVDCGRCSAVCPVGINISKNIIRLLKEVKNDKK